MAKRPSEFSKVVFGEGMPSKKSPKFKEGSAGGGFLKSKTRRPKRAASLRLHSVMIDTIGTSCQSGVVLLGASHLYGCDPSLKPLGLTTQHTVCACVKALTFPEQGQTRVCALRECAFTRPQLLAVPSSVHRAPEACARAAHGMRVVSVAAARIRHRALHRRVVGSIRTPRAIGHHATRGKQAQREVQCRTHFCPDLEKAAHCVLGRQCVQRAVEHAIFTHIRHHQVEATANVHLHKIKSRSE
eukprot:3726205-Prymnesium_polylepis.3